MSPETQTTKAEAKNETQTIVIKEGKHTAQWVLDVFVALGAVAQFGIGVILIYQLIAYQASNELTRQSLEISRKNFDLTAQSVALTQKSIELTQKSLDLTQQSVRAEQEGLKYAQQANDISQKGLIASNSPSLEVRVIGAKEMGGSLEITYYIANRSNSPARDIMAFCSLDKVKGYIDAAVLGSNVSIMPNQNMDFASHLMFFTGNIQEAIKDVDSGVVPIKVIVVYSDSLGDRSAFSEAFWKRGNEYTIGDTVYNIPREEIMKLIDKASAISPK